MRCLCFLFCLLAGVAFAGKPIDVILVAGQSNAVGFDAPPAEMPSDPVDQRIKFWWRVGDPPPDKHDSASDGWTTLQAQPLGNPIQPRRGRQYGNFAQATGGFGPEVGLARAIVNGKHDHELAIIKVAFSGTHVDGDWNPNLSADDSNYSEQDCRGACYRTLVQETHSALQSLQGYEPNLVALVWVQGESDATADRAGRYQRNIGEVVAALRRDLQSPNLIALLGVNTKFGGGKNEHLGAVIDAQQDFAASDSLAEYVDTEGAAIANNVHFDAKGTIEVGQRFAKALRSMQARHPQSISK